MVRTVALLIFALTASAPAYAAENDGMTPAIAQCLKQNAVSVEAAEPDLTKATEYLVSSVCAAPIAEEQRRLTQVRAKAMAERNRAQCEERVNEQKARAAKLGRTLDRTSENCRRGYDNILDATRVPLTFGAGIRPPAAMSMAAKLILDRRLAHNKSRP